MRRIGATALLLLLGGCFGDPEILPDTSGTSGSSTSESGATTSVTTSTSAGSTTSSGMTTTSTTSTTMTTTTSATTTDVTEGSGSDSAATSGSVPFCDDGLWIVCDDFDDGGLNPIWTVNQTGGGDVSVQDVASLTSPPNGLLSTLSDAGGTALIQAPLTGDPADGFEMVAQLQVEDTCGTAGERLVAFDYRDGAGVVYRLRVNMQDGGILIQETDVGTNTSDTTMTPHSPGAQQAFELRVQVIPAVSIAVAVNGSDLTVRQLTLWPAATGSIEEVRFGAGLSRSGTASDSCTLYVDDIRVDQL